MRDQTCREGRNVRRSRPAGDRHEPLLRPGGAVDSRQDSPISPGDPAARGCQGPPRPAGLSSATSEMPARGSPGPKLQEDLNKHPTSLCLEHAGGEAVASGGQRAECHPKTCPERFGAGGRLSMTARGRRAEGNTAGRSQAMETRTVGSARLCAPLARPPRPPVARPPVGGLFSMHHLACLGAFRAVTGGNRQESCPRACRLTEVSPRPPGPLLRSS